MSTDWLMVAPRLYYAGRAWEITEWGGGSDVLNTQWRAVPGIRFEPLYFRDFWASAPLQTQHRRLSTFGSSLPTLQRPSWPQRGTPSRSNCLIEFHLQILPPRAQEGPWAGKQSKPRSIPSFIQGEVTNGLESLERFSTSLCREALMKVVLMDPVVGGCYWPQKGSI